jgi:hypothetical protein
LHGYANLPNIFSHNEIAEVADVISQSQLKRRRAAARPILSVPAVSKVAEDLRLLSIAREVLGQTAIPFAATLFDKSPSFNWLVAWHQDTALPLVKKMCTSNTLRGSKSRTSCVLPPSEARNDGSLAPHCKTPTAGGRDKSQTKMAT